MSNKSNQIKSIFEKFGTDSDACEHGSWLYLDKETKFKIKAAFKFNYKFRELLLSDELKEIIKKNDSSEMNEKEKEEMLENWNIKLVSESLISDWKGVFDREGKEIEANIENFKDVLKKCPNLIGKIIDFSKDQKNFTLTDEAANRIAKK